MDKYIESQARAGISWTIDKMMCSDCIYKGNGNKEAYCDVYKENEMRKPNEVLNGGVCEYFDLEE